MTAAPASGLAAVVAAGEVARERAELLAAQLEVPCVASAAGIPDALAHELVLVADAEGLSLARDKMVLRADIARELRRLRPGALARELLVRAARIKHADGPVHAVDATAGLGEDALLLAAAGFTVDLYERNLVIAALLEDALRRARAVPELAEVACRMRLAGSDSIAALREMAACARDGEAARPAFCSARPDVVYLDPMFPERRKSAAVKKKFQLLHGLEVPCEDEETLLDAARMVRPRKVVVKRPVKGPYLAGVRPSYSIAGKAVRYDCYVGPADAR